MQLTSGQKRRVGITDTTLRDGHQSLLATRMKTKDMLPIAEKMDEMGFHSLEVWGGATFDSCMRFLNEDPWERLKALRKAFKKTKLQMLLRGQNLVGYKHYADDVVEAFVAKSAEHGIDIFRIFDALNDVRNMQKAIEEVKKNGKHVQATICYTIGPIYDLDYYLKLGKELKELGADSICIKDMAGILTPYAAYELVLALKKELALPIQMHTHYTSGMGSMMYLKAVEAGADVIDTANSALALGTSQPATETMVAVLNDSGYETGIDLTQVSSLAEYFKEVRKNYAEFDVYKAGVDVNVLRYQVPGGMLSNFISQLTQANAMDKFDEVLKEVPRVREDMGFPPLVTPSSQIVGSQAVLNVLTGERYKMVTNEVKNYMKGLYGRAPGKVNEEVRKKIIGDEKPVTVRPADLIEPQIEAAKKEIGDLAKNMEELLMYILFPQVAKPFLEGTLTEEKPQPKPAPKEEKKPEPEKSTVTPIKTNLSSGVGSAARFAASRKNMRTGAVNFNFNGNIEKLKIVVDGEGYKLDLGKETETKEENLKVNDRSSVKEKTVKKEVKTEASSQVVTVTAPMPGKIFKILLAEGSPVKQGDKVLILEAMKMENEILAPADGIVTKLVVKEGDAVNPGDPLFAVE
ncbi:MAG: sodium-extruding oxaloacetate decarboxylase subunit alpha [Clostridia bacterium]|nr:sodium-extruding oxaloacetate decarboxylase subunit alpha [Clostridia bacterium]